MKPITCRMGGARRNPSPPRLVIISPSRDESNYIGATLHSMANQIRPPDRWVIVDDGSTDRTGEIVSRYAEKHPWMELVRRHRSGKRRLGPGVVEAFDFGLDALGDDYWDIIAKLDCDIEFEPDFIQKILARFENPRVGMVGGTGFMKIGSRLIRERWADFHVPGMTKFYRRPCFEQIGGLQPLYGWDILDETDARRHGWITLSDPRIVFIHHRVQSSALGSVRGRKTWGWGAYAVGSHPVFAVIRGFYRMLEPPWIMGGFAFLFGFFASYFDPRINRTTDKDLIRYLRREQIHRILHGNRLPSGLRGRDE